MVNTATISTQCIHGWNLNDQPPRKDLDIMNTETLEYMCKDYKVEIPLDTEYSDENQKRNIIIERLVVCAKNLIGPYKYDSSGNNQ